jgi:type IV pilus assembly protein PilY1
MYVGDLHGQVFRFDINSGAVPDSLVSGGLFAKLGLTLASPVADQEYVDNRKFFYSPDASLITTVGPTFLNIAIGSGHREAPIRDTTVDNYFYSLRDYNVFGALPNDAYRATCGASTGPCHEIINHDSLLDVTATAIPDSAVVTASTTKGWKMGLTGPGEKALAESRTFQNAVYFTTYEPRNSQATPDDDLVCAPRIGVNRLYVLRVADAGAAINLDIFTEGLERSKELSQGSIAPEVVFVFPTPPPNPNNPNAPVPAVPPVCLVGVENCGSGILNPPVRTYWRQRGAD